MQKIKLKYLWPAWLMMLLCVQLTFIPGSKISKPPPVVVKNESTMQPNLYDALHLDSCGLSKQAFDNAVKGYQYLVSAGKISHGGILSIIDFSLPSKANRLFVIDLEKDILLFSTLVSHGRNSGTATANRFSNKPESFQSSLGFYITGTTYNGKHGYSLRLEGLEKGINDNAFTRGIVMHCASYVSRLIAQSQGYIGRSEGCPSLPREVYKGVISEIKNGSCLFVYSPDPYYQAHSPILKNG